MQRESLKGLYLANDKISLQNKTQRDLQILQETMILEEINRQKNRQIARTLDDLKGLNLPKLVEDRIKQGFYDMADNLARTIQEKQINDQSRQA